MATCSAARALTAGTRAPSSQRAAGSHTHTAPRLVSSFKAPLSATFFNTRHGVHRQPVHSKRVALCRAEAEVQAPTAAPVTKPQAAVWELDFCSRPILDERKKKVWELLICDPERNFEYSEYFPNNKINSVQLRNALERIIAEEGVPAPQKIRFFRSQMSTIITKACADLPSKCVPSRRCMTLMSWLEERHQTVYPNHPGFDPNAPPLMTYEAGAPQELPDALRGEQWAFVMLPLSEVLAEGQRTVGRGGFGEVLTGATVGIEGNPDEVFVPGVAVFSQRAIPLAAWTNGLDLAGMKADTEQGSLILETGVNTQFRYANYRRTNATTQEANEWEEAKLAVQGLHFLAIQKDPEAPECTGFWMMRDFKPSTSI